MTRDPVGCSRRPAAGVNISKNQAARVGTGCRGPVFYTPQCNDARVHRGVYTYTYHG